MNRKLRPLFAVAGMLFVATSGRADDIDDYIKEAREKQHIPAISLAVIKNGTVVKAAAYGMADLEHEIAARPETVFKIGSVSKQFIASGIMLLVQDGKLHLDDKLGKYISGIPESWQPISLRHLLTHTSGLVRESPAFNPYKVQPGMDLIQAAYTLPLNFKPGEKWEYCNLGYYLLAQVIETVSGKPFGDFLTERIFAPLKMTSTRLTTVAGIVPNRAGGYVWKTDHFQNEENWPAIRPSGAFLSTILDLAKWEASLIAGDLLTESSKKQMWTPVVLNDGKPYPYGFGWQLDDWPAGSKVPAGVPMIRHGGSLPGFRAGYFRWPTYGLAVIVLTNMSNVSIDGLGANIATRYLPELKTAGQPNAAAAGAR